jgi:hypothetical protein
MKVAFIIPRDNDNHGPLSQYAQCRVLPPVGLARMAGMIGKKASVSVIDERIDDKHHNGNPHVAVIFINSYNRQRAYDVANYYRQCGSTVIFTGPVLNKAMGDAAKFADCLFVGDSEENMPSFLNDFYRGKTKQVYQHYVNVSHRGNVAAFPGSSLSLAS